MRNSIPGSGCCPIPWRSMIISPIADLDVVIRDTLREVRRGIATARSANQSNPATGLMADLPEFVEFEIQVITGHQILSRNSSDSDSGTTTDSDTNTEAGSEATTITANASESDSASGSGSKSQSRSGSGSQSESGSRSNSTSQSGSSSRSSSGSQSGSRSQSRSGSRSSSRSQSSSGSRSGSTSSSRSGSSSTSRSGSDKSISQDQSDNGRTYGIIDEETGDFVGSGSSDLSGEPTSRDATVSC